MINSLVSHKPFFTHIRRRRQRNPRDGGDTVPEIFKRSHDEASAIHGEFVPHASIGITASSSYQARERDMNFDKRRLL